MLIDWFTIGAQTVNFLILVWLMKRFLYKAILDAVDAREKRIASELADADTRKAEAQKERDEFQHKNAEFDQQRAALLGKAADEAETGRQRLLDGAQKAADDMSAQRQDALRREHQSLGTEITRRTQEEVFAIARKALADLATTSLDSRIAEVFTRRLEAMGSESKTSLAAAIKSSVGAALVRSAFDLPPDQRAEIQNAINVAFSADVPLRFETAPDLVGGIEFSVNGQKVAWSISDYLATMQTAIGTLLDPQTQPQPASR